MELRFSRNTTGFLILFCINEAQGHDYFKAASSLWYVKIIRIQDTKGTCSHNLKCEANYGMCYVYIKSRKS